MKAAAPSPSASSAAPAQAGATLFSLFFFALFRSLRGRDRGERGPARNAGPAVGSDAAHDGPAHIKRAHARARGRARTRSGRGPPQPPRPGPPPLPRQPPRGGSPQLKSTPFTSSVPPPPSLPGDRRPPPPSPPYRRSPRERVRERVLNNHQGWLVLCLHFSFMSMIRSDFWRECEITQERGREGV